VGVLRGVLFAAFVCKRDKEQTKTESQKEKERKKPKFQTM